MKEVRDPGGIDVGIALHLASKETLVEAGSHQRSPRLVAEPAGSLRQRRDLIVERREFLPHSLESRRGTLHLDGRWRVRLPLPLHRQPPRSYLRFEVRLLSHELLESHLVGKKVDEGRHLRLEFAQDQRRAPAQIGLGNVNVTKQVVADIENLVARKPEGVFDQ